MQHELRATWYEETAQLLSLTELKSHLFYFELIGLTIDRWRRGGNRSTRRNPPVGDHSTDHRAKQSEESESRLD